jgi:hypothetical protein
MWTPATRYTIMTHAESVWSVHGVQVFSNSLYISLVSSYYFYLLLFKKYGQCGHIGVFPKEYMHFQCPLSFSEVDTLKPTIPGSSSGRWLCWVSVRLFVFRNEITFEWSITDHRPRLSSLISSVRRLGEEKRCSLRSE